ncbi:MAG: hypothetical protein ABW056_08145 [Thermoanaerobaculia bacterium]
MRRALVTSFAAACFVCSAVGSAELLTKTFDYKPVDGIQNIQLVVDDVKIQQVVFQVSKEKEGEAPSRVSRNEAVVRVDNESPSPVVVGVAVVVLDEAGNIVAAGSGATRAGWVAAGNRVPVQMRFPFVSRNFAKARKFTITMEVESKAGSAVPPPAATGK